MMKKLGTILALIASLAFAGIPAEAAWMMNPYRFGNPEPTTPTLFPAASCSYDATNTTTYSNHVLTFPGVDDSWSVFIYAIFISWDSANVFNVTAVTFDGVSATEAQDDNGVQTVSTAAYRTNNAAPVTGASTVNVAVSHSEGILTSVVCGWVLAGDSGTLTTDSSPHASNATGAALALTAATTNSSGFVIGACGTLTGQTFTWSVLSERSDTSQTEGSYSAADAAGTGSSMSVTCDPSGATATSGMAIAFH